MKTSKSTPTSARHGEAATTGAPSESAKKSQVTPYSGKDEESQPAKKALASPGVTPGGAEILKQRGVLSPDEIHRLAHKGQKGRLSQRDNVHDPGIRRLKLSNSTPLKAHGVTVNETGL